MFYLRDQLRTWKKTFAFPRERRILILLDCTSDIDFLVGTDAANAIAVVGCAAIKPDDLSRPGQVVQLSVKPNRIDLITSITGIDFREAWAPRVTGSIDGIPVFFIDREDLILNKEAAGRPKNLGDALALRERKPRD